MFYSFCRELHSFQQINDDSFHYNISSLNNNNNNNTFVAFFIPSSLSDSVTAAVVVER